MSKIPALHEVKKAVDQILLEENRSQFNSLNNSERFIQKMNKLFPWDLKAFINLLYHADHKSIPQRFYRLRKESSTINEKLIAEFSCPPKHVVNNFQRANIPFHPVFYCSGNPYTAMVETISEEDRVRKGIVFYMSEWEAKSDKEIRICPFLFDNISDTNPYKALSDGNKKKLYALLGGYSLEERNSIYGILTYLSTLYTCDNTHVVSGYLAHINLYANHKLSPDIFIYPSVQTDRETVNFAIHPNAVIEKLYLKRVFKLRITNYNPTEKHFVVSIGWVGLNINGYISWNKTDIDTPAGSKKIEELDKLFR